MKDILQKVINIQVNMKSPSKNKKIELHFLSDELSFLQIIRKSTKMEISIRLKTNIRTKN